jgi:hypothetical protein
VEAEVEDQLDQEVQVVVELAVLEQLFQVQDVMLDLFQ